ncbi:MAG: SDR family oxidoreductase [Actinobacteria bacterium]|nr:SDR family oxidoreductase [Actinomycetota bacterium]
MIEVGDLSATVAIVTGAARGQGAEFARLMCERGAAVLLTDVLEEEGEEVAAALGERAAFVPHDVSDPAAWTAVVAQAEERFGKLTALVNNAGVNRRATLPETDEETWALHLAVNQSGPFYGMREAAPAIERAGGGAIVNICSGSALYGSHNFFAYSASKWALRGMTRAAAVELAPRGIRVNGIFPGLVETPMVEEVGIPTDATTLARIPLGRLATPLDVARAVAFLVSPEADYLTGIELLVDGGMFA